MKKTLMLAVSIGLLAVLTACGSREGVSSRSQGAATVEDVLSAAAENADETNNAEVQVKDSNGSQTETENAVGSVNSVGSEDMSGNVTDGNEVDENISSDSEVTMGSTSEGVDVDLTQLSSTMVYSEVYNMMTQPDQYRGKMVKMDGSFAVYYGEHVLYTEKCRAAITGKKTIEYIKNS